MGKAYLVGAGPGDPRLITVRGAELLRRADVVLHDALVSHSVLELVNPSAELFDVGRRAGESRLLTQERINRMLVDLARRHDVVVRLKGGDPFVFGRGGEEALALFHAGVPFEIVPGVTAGVGALAHAGIPVTHRGLSTRAVFVTAHDAEDPAAEEEWRHLAKVGGTLVIYMGGTRIRAVTDRLIRLGRKPDEAAAVIESGTLPQQRVVQGRLDDLAERAGEPHGPALIVVGEVTKLREQLAWLEPGPLAGRTVLVARARAQRSRIAESLRGLGAAVIEFPTVRSRSAPGAAGVPSAVRGLAPGGAVVFTGAAAVRGFVRALTGAGMDVRALAGFSLVGVGRETIAALGRMGLRCDLALRSYLPIRVAAELHRAMGSLAAHPVLLVRDGQTESALGEGLEAAGASVTQIEVAMRTVDERGRQSLERLIARKRLDAVVLASSSAAEALVAAGLKLPHDARVFAIGPNAATTAERLGLPPARVPNDSGADALVAEVTAALREAGRDDTAESSLAASSD